jgi:hypothetical protein
MRSRIAAVVALALVSSVILDWEAGAGAAAPSPAQVGEWSDPIDVGVIGIHAALLKTGEVLLYEFPFDQIGSEAHLIDPVTGDNVDVSVPFRRNIFCSGHSMLPDGRLLVTGGQRYDAFGFNGIRAVSIFDPTTQTWTNGQPMFRPRWYPTNVSMPDGTTLVLTGLGADGVTLQRQMERYDPATGEWTLLPPSANSDSDLYARMFVLPDGTVFRAAPNQEGEIFDPVTNTWSFVDNMNYGWRSFPGAVLMPDLTTVFITGGSVTGSSEAIDLSAGSPQWEGRASMHHPRYNHNVVQLPDGTLLAVGGGADPNDLYGAPVKQAELYDPALDVWTEMASQAANRTYHSTALLLPDGRVMSAGTDGGDMPRTIEYYSPPYLFEGPRPTITRSPPSLGYGQRFRVQTPEGADIVRVTLIRLGSATHSVNFEQRQVDLEFVPQAGRLSVRAPASPNLAPPGDYMLFILNSEGVPSIAPIVHVE